VSTMLHLKWINHKSGMRLFYFMAFLLCDICFLMQIVREFRGEYTTNIPTTVLMRTSLVSPSGWWTIPL
jgi:hypothetical protein